MLATSPNREALLQTAQQIPGSARVLGQLAELLTDVNSGLDDIALLLRRDTGLAARIIRISNSVMFGVGSRIATIEEAVNRVGYAEIYRLTGLATAAQLADHHLSLYGVTGAQLRDNTLLIALCAESLAMRIDADSRVAYTAGLLRSTGKIILDRYAKKHAPTCQTFFSSGSISFDAWEQNVFAITNSEVARLVLNAWRFPAEITEPLCHQYFTTNEISAVSSTAIILRIARSLTAAKGFGLIGEREHEEITDATFARAGLTPLSAQECIEEALAGYLAVKSLL